MHFVSENAGRLLVRPSKDVFSQASGEKVAILPTIWLKYERGMCPDWAAQAAAAHFSFSKRPKPGSLGGADIPVATWCVYVDTEAWAVMNGHDDAIRELAEEKLLADPEMLRVTPPVQRPPWPNYDKLAVAGTRTAEKVAARNIETAAEIGVSLDDLIAYESATLRREGVLAAYQEALDAVVPDPVAAAFAVEA